MSVSNVSIANMAFTLLSVDRIQAMNDTSEQARRMSAIFEPTRDAMLSEHPWNFARSERVLSLLTDEPVLESYAYAYQLPSDCLRVLRLEDDYHYSIFGDKLYSNSDNPTIEYIKKITDPTKFSAGFVKALASRLAANLAFGLTQNATLSANIDAIAERDLKNAKWSDAQEGQSIKVIRGSMVDGY